MGKVVKTEFGVTEAKPKKEKGKYYKSTKKLLENYVNLKIQISSFEEVLKDRYKKTFEEAKIEDMTAEEIAEMMITKSELTRSEVKLLECRRSYLRSKYMVQLIDNALEELKLRDNGMAQYEIINAIIFNGVKMDDIEDYMAEKGCPVATSTAYRMMSQGISTLSVLLWGYKAIADELTEELINPEIQNLFDLVA